VDRYKQNAKWLACFAPFQGLSISAAYLTPFFLQRGLSLSEIFLLQSIFSVAFLLWELPSGLIADRYGRAFSIKLSVPIAAVATILYGFSTKYWQFVVCELVLALANGLISGIDSALLFDSLKVEYPDKEDEKTLQEEFVKVSQRIQACGYVAILPGALIAIALVHYISISSTIVADGLMAGAGAFFAFKLVEAPPSNGGQEAVRLSAWHAMKQLSSNVEARWLVVLGSALSASTYLAFWLSAPYYTKLGIPAVLFSGIFAIRSLWKALLSHCVTQKHHLERNMIAYASLAGLVYLAMASGQWWLSWAVLGHDAVQALQSQPITARLNAHMKHEFRATMNSLVNLAQRLGYSVAGPLLGLLIDRTSLGVGFAAIGITCSTIAFVALARLHRLKTFQEKR